MADEKVVSVATGVKREVIEQATHIAASKVGKAIRRMLQGSIPKSVLQSLGKNGAVEIASSIAAIVARSLLPDTGKGELIKDFVTEVLSEASELDEDASSRAGSSVDGGAVQASVDLPKAREATDAVLALAEELVQKYGSFIKRFLAEHNEQEAEHALKWLNTLSIVELEGFAHLSYEEQCAYWMAKEDPVQRKNLLEQARRATENFRARMAEAWTAFEAWCAVRVSQREPRANILEEELALRREYLERLRGQRDYSRDPSFWDRFVFWQL